MAFYLIDKEKGVGSNESLSIFKKQFKINKAGFSGVLDPFATGLLIIATDGDTKFLDLFSNSNKVYSGKIFFGQTTDTLDTDGKITDKLENFTLTKEEILKKIKEKFIGKILQTPPNYSNIKVDGKRAHALSREGKVFELKKVEREIFFFDILNFEKNILDFKVKVSPGTYIRSLASDLGKDLNIPSMLIELRREKIKNISVPSELTLVPREEIIKFKFKKESEKIIGFFLNGKKVNLEEKENDLILFDDNFTLWVKKTIDKSYKIHKRIE